MKIYIYIIVALVFGLIVACNNEEEVIPSSEIINLSSVSGEGQIELKWEYPEGENTIRYIEVSFWNHEKGKEVKKTASVQANNIIIENTKLKYGEYNFKVQPFSSTFTPGKVYEVSEVSQRAPIIDFYTSMEFALTVEDVYVEGIKDSKPENMLDGNLETFINTDYSKPAGTVFWIDVSIPKEQEFLKFSYVNRNHTAASFPSEIECFVKEKEEDDWTLIETLTMEKNILPTIPLGAFISKELKSPIKFNYFRFRVSKTHTGKPNFSLAEFRVFDVTHTYFDPEEE